MRESEVSYVMVIVRGVPTEVLPHNSLHLIVELIPALTALKEEDAHTVGPVIYEEQSHPDVYWIVGRSRERGRIGEGEGCSLGEHTLPVGESGARGDTGSIEVGVIWNCGEGVDTLIVVTVIPKDVASARTLGDIAIRSAHIGGPISS